MCAATAGALSGTLLRISSGSQICCAITCIFGPSLKCAPLREVSSFATFCFGIYQLKQQGVYIFRWFSCPKQVVPKVIHPSNRQPPLKRIQHQVPFLPFHNKLASFGLIVAEGSELVECVKQYLGDYFFMLRKLEQFSHNTSQSCISKSFGFLLTPTYGIFLRLQISIIVCLL